MIIDLITTAVSKDKTYADLWESKTCWEMLGSTALEAATVASFIATAGSSTAAVVALNVGRAALFTGGTVWDAVNTESTTNFTVNRVSEAVRKAEQEKAELLLSIVCSDLAMSKSALLETINSTELTKEQKIEAIQHHASKTETLRRDYDQLKLVVSGRHVSLIKRKIVLDTNVYIKFAETGQLESLFDKIEGFGASVVMVDKIIQELYGIANGLEKADGVRKAASDALEFINSKSFKHMLSTEKCNSKITKVKYGAHASDLKIEDAVQKFVMQDNPTTIVTLDGMMGAWARNELTKHAKFELLTDIFSVVTPKTLLELI
jgi:predicted nucleic acid-binding protein